jgi:hypothetical protein
LDGLGDGGQESFLLFIRPSIEQVDFDERHIDLLSPRI